MQRKGPTEIHTPPWARFKHRTHARICTGFSSRLNDCGTGLPSGYRSLSGTACRAPSSYLHCASRHAATAGCDALQSQRSAVLLSSTVHTAGVPQGTGRVSFSIHGLRKFSSPLYRGYTCRTAGSLTSCVLHSTVLPSASGSRGSCTVALVSSASLSPPGIEKPPEDSLSRGPLCILRSLLL